MLKEQEQQIAKAKECRKKGNHYLGIRRDIGVCRFGNTGGKYIIERCIFCGSEYVREL